MAKGSFVLLSFLLAGALAGAQEPKGVAGESGPDLETPYGGSVVTCSQPSMFVVPRPLLERAKLKARLAVLLRESLFDDANGIVNIARENEIKKLANKLKNERID